MADATPPPLAGPPLERAAATTPRPHWLARHTAGVAALALGVIGFAVVAFTADKVWATPDWRLTVPILVVTAAAATASFVRREGAPALPLLGVGLAAAATVLGWFLITAIVVAATGIVLLILSHAM